jgi:hypothetical protein
MGSVTDGETFGHIWFWDYFPKVPDYQICGLSAAKL